MWGYLFKGFRFIVVLGLLALSTAQVSACPGDFDGNGRVDIADFLALAGAFGARSGDAKYNAVVDMDGSGAIDISDFLAFAGVFGTMCEDPSAGSVSEDRKALVALYNATDGPNWANNENWLTEAPLEDWYGVDTDASGRVVRLVLAGHFDDEVRVFVPFGLSGTLPPELGLLAELEVLDLQINGLTGTIPPELWELTNLSQLSLAYNSLRGLIPPKLGDLANLRRLYLRENNLTGSIPPELGNLTNLRDLNLGYNELTGPIPPELGGLTELRWLSLRVNGLTGPIPPELDNLAKLLDLLLDSNSLTGSIPPEFGNLSDLHKLFLYDNGLTGAIPVELGNLNQLRWLTMSGNNLTGSIPPELGNLTNLQSLSLSNNNLTGQVPPELGNLTNLQSLSLATNLLTGSLPLSFAGLTNLETIGCRRTEGVCVPATDEFREWTRQVRARGNIENSFDVPFCDEIDASALENLYKAANGDGWVRSDGWLEDENLGRWHGVQIDSIGRVSSLDLSGNGLSGSVPDALGFLANLKLLRLGNNALTGRLPLSLAGVPLEEFDYDGTSICMPDDVGFRGWVNGIPRHSGTGVQCPPLTDRDILTSLYWNCDGPNWRRRTGWTTDAPLDQWHGVETDAAGRVVELWLRNNGLTGSLPVELGELSQLRQLSLSYNRRLSGPVPPELGDLVHLRDLVLEGNQLSGDIPSSLGKLSELRSLRLGRNRLSGSIPPVLGDLSSLEWLALQGNQLSGEIPRELAKLSNLTRLNLSANFLTGPISPGIGDLEQLKHLDLAENQFSGSIPSVLGSLGAMEFIRLADNELTGHIPPQLGALSRLSILDLSSNELTGPIPAELGGISTLSELLLFGNELSGAIPTELGDLASLTILDLADNQLSGAIPARLGDLANLVTLNMGGNELAGPLPAELGYATKLEGLDLRSNALTGPVPPEFGNLTLLNSLILADNLGLSGPLPPGITSLEQLERFMAGETALCRPADSEFAAWFRGIADRRLMRCEGGASVYLTQTVQSWDDPVPLLAGEPALLRVFVTASHGGTVTMPGVRATFYVDGVERHSVFIAAGTQSIPRDVAEGDLALSVNAEIPDWVIVPGLEMVIEVDPEGALDPVLGVMKRIPEEGRLAVDVQPVPPFRLTMIPFLSETRPDLTTVDDVSAMAADPDGHELLRDVRRLLPIAELAVVAREPVITSTPDSRRIVAQVEAMRIMEGGAGYWMGVWDGRLNPGIITAIRGKAYLGGQASMSVRKASTMAHELGHNLGLKHAPCGSPASTDPWFPHFGGSIGAWGYDLERNTLVPPGTADLMSYCTQGGYWISDFFFNKAVAHRLATDDAAAALSAEADPTRALLFWGGRDQDGVPYLDPAFVVEASPSVPASGGEYTIRGAAADGMPIFSFSFDMPVTADAEGEETSFVFALPVQREWAGNLVSITLSGPGGSATLDESTDRPMAILRDPKTRQVRGFLSDLPAGESAQAAAKHAMVADPELEVLFSRGIPDLR